MNAIALTLMNVQFPIKSMLNTIPTIPVVQEAQLILAEAESPEMTIPEESWRCRNTSMPPAMNY